MVCIIFRGKRVGYDWPYRTASGEEPLPFRVPSPCFSSISGRVNLAYHLGIDDLANDPDFLRASDPLWLKALYALAVAGALWLVFYAAVQ